jgi:hypothetical protein
MNLVRVFPLKGLGHEKECKYFENMDNKGSNIGVSTGFWTLKMSLWWAVVFGIFNLWKYMGENTFIGVCCQFT